jgi:hypothetical protein
MEVAMKRALVFSLIAALIAVALVAPAEAKKKKKKKPPAPVAVDATYFLRRDGEGCTDAAVRFLSLTDAEDIDTGSCGNQTYGIPAQVLGADPITFATREGDGIPMTLDATKEIKGLIGVKSSSAQGTVRVGAGNTTLHVELLGTVGDETKTIATGDFDYQVTPGDINQVYEVEITLTPDVALDKAVFTSLTLALQNTGDSVAHGFYTTDNPASNFTLGIWQ